MTIYESSLKLNHNDIEATKCVIKTPSYNIYSIQRIHLRLYLAIVSSLSAILNENIDSNAPVSPVDR